MGIDIGMGMGMGQQEPSAYVAARETVHRVAAHILARRRFDVSGRFGLRAAPEGILTPAFGEGPEVIRIARTFLVREVGGDAAYLPIQGSTLGDLAAFVEVDLSMPFSAGEDTPVLGEVDTPLVLGDEAMATIAEWYDLGWRTLDAVVACLPAGARPSTIQLWPEHFDAATDVGLASGERVNLGFSPGDGFEAEPYAYVGPWTSERRGDPEFWNAPFGAVLRWADVQRAQDPAQACRRFMTAGLANAAGSSLSPDE